MNKRVIIPFGAVTAMVVAFVIVSCSEVSEADIQQAGMTALAQTNIAKTDEYKATTDAPGDLLKITPTLISTKTPIPTPFSTNTPVPALTQELPTSTHKIIQTPSPDQLWAINYAGWEESGNVTIEIARLVVGYKEHIPYDWGQKWDDIDVVGEIIFKVTNKNDVTVNVFPDQGTVQIGSEQIELVNYIFNTFGESVGGEIYPGVTKIGGIWFGITRSDPGEISEIIYRTDGPNNSETGESLGPDYKIAIDASQKRWEEMPEELD